MTIRALSVASEVWPLVKTGGLADVTGALPGALAAHGVETATMLPGYPSVLRGIGRGAKPVARLVDLFGGPARLLRATADRLAILVLDAPHLFARDGGPYGDASGADWPDNWRRFAAFSAAAAEVAEDAVPGWRPDIVHAHDWQAALTLAYLRYRRSPVPSVVTVHNLAFQGRYPAAIFPELGLPDEAFAVDGVEYYGGVGYLKAGLEAADAITTVSPTYAQEIRTPDFGMGLEGLMNARAGRLHGIVNGIDTGIWNPAADPHLAATYSPRAMRSRAANRRAIEQRFGLEQDGGPIFCVVSRLTWQKGMDLLAALADALVAMGGRLALLGSGDGALEAAFLAAAERHRGRIGVVIGYDEGVSHLLQGGADAILIPSRFEPCGLTQLYGQRYGCVPIVARTGGLADTVIDANEAALAAGVATGFQFAPTTLDGLRGAIERAIRAFAEPELWARIVRSGMKMDYSWDRSAARYAALYRTLIAERRDAA